MTLLSSGLISESPAIANSNGVSKPKVTTRSSTSDEQGVEVHEYKSLSESSFKIKGSLTIDPFSVTPGSTVILSITERSFSLKTSLAPGNKLNLPSPNST